MRKIYSATTIPGACALLIAGFFLPWFSFPYQVVLLNGDYVSLKQPLPNQVSGLGMLLGGKVYAIAYAPYVVPEVFALLWLLPICALLITSLAVAELSGCLWKRPWSRGTVRARWALYLLLFVLMGLPLGPIIVGPRHSFLGVAVEMHRFSGIWISLAGFLLLVLSTSLGVLRTPQKPFSMVYEAKDSAEQAMPLARRHVLCGLLGLVATATIGSGGYLLQRRWAVHHALATFPLLMNYLQPPGPIRNRILPVLRDDLVVWLPDGKHLITFSSACYAESRDAFSGQLLVTYRFPAQDLACSPDGNSLALLDPLLGTPTIVAISDGHLVSAAQPQKVISASLCLAWSPDGKRIAIGGIQQNGQSGIFCYEIANKHNSQIYQTGQGGDLTMMAWSPDGRYLAGIGNTLDTETGRLFVWETGSGRLIFSTLANGWSSFAWSPDSQRLALAYERLVEIWEPSRSLKALEYQEHPTLVWSLAWSPRGDLIASASEVDGFVHVWESATGRLSSLYQGDTRPITDIAWSPDGSYLATCNNFGGSVFVWQIS